MADAPAPMAFADEGDDFDAEGCWRAPVNAWTDPECALESKRFHVMFEAGLSKLPPQQLRAFQLREVVGMEADEVCREMDITSNNLCVLLHRARGQLRRYLDRDYFCAAA